MGEKDDSVVTRVEFEALQQAFVDLKFQAELRFPKEGEPKAAEAESPTVPEASEPAS